jgi:hypothetical protein
MAVNFNIFLRHKWKCKSNIENLMIKAIAESKKFVRQIRPNLNVANLVKEQACRGRKRQKFKC